MRTASTLAVVAYLARVALAQGQPMINTPAALIQCQPVLLSFSGGTAPYFLSVLPAAQVSAAAIEDLPNQAAAGSYTWTVNLPAGTNVTLRITDSKGLTNYAAPLVIQTSSDSSCLGTTPTTGGSPGTAVPTSAATGTGTTLISTAPSATVTVASSGPSPTNINSTSPISPGYNFTCAQGTLTYGVTNAALRGISLAQAIKYFGNWSYAVPGFLNGHTGAGVGSVRTWTYGGNVTFTETLQVNRTNSSTGALHQQWNFTYTQPVSAGSLIIYDSFDDLQVYSNASTNVTTLQYFILACFNNQTLGLTALAQEIQTSVAAWTANISSSAGSTMKTRRLVDLSVE